jgi:hypothetical protein
MAAVSNSVSSKLSLFFRNGVPQVGLEVGTDIGLSPDEYIRIPKSFAKAWAYCKEGDGTYEAVDTDTTADLRGKPGWVVVAADDTKTRFVVCGSKDGGDWYVTTEGSSTRVPVSDVHVDAHTEDDLRRFILANEGHVREHSLRADDVKWVHAIRFWSVVTGLVVGSKNKEYVLVDDPVGKLEDADELASFIVDYHGTALTAVAARAASWRRSNHATGGSPASGFPRRWLESQGLWPAGNEKVDKDVAAKMVSATDAFYVATHAAAVHNVLALMAPSDEGHWASIDPRYGLLADWEIMPSTLVRIAPKTQVAGTAMVVDAMVVFKMLLQSSLAPLLENFSEWRSLLSQYKIVEENGVRVASYAQWFLDGHPENISRVNFDQKSSACANLIGELAVVAGTYYGQSTIGQSMALRNAARQLASETSKDLWSALAKERKAASQAAVIKAYKRIMGASSAASIANLSSNDEGKVGVAVDEFNKSLGVVAAAVGITGVPTLSKEMIVERAKADAETSDESSDDE